MIEINLTQKFAKTANIKLYFLISSLCLGLSACVQAPSLNPQANPTQAQQLRKQLPLGHRVKAQEHLQDIAKRYHQSLSQLIAWNQLRPPYQLYTGQILQVSAIGGAWIELQKQGQENQIQSLDLEQISSLQAAITGQIRAHAWQWPTQGKTKRTHSKTGRRGINIYGNYQQAIHASAAGKVLYSGKGLTGYDGHLIIIRHPSACLSVYAHNQKKAAILTNTQVKAGQTIAQMGYNSQGQASLHFEISCAEKTLDPLSLLN